MGGTKIKNLFLSIETSFLEKNLQNGIFVINDEIWDVDEFLIVVKEVTNDKEFYCNYCSLNVVNECGES